MNRLGPETLDRLVKLLGMLGSAHDGEIAAAGRKAHALVRKHGLTWTDIIVPPLVPQEFGWRDHVDRLNAWERQFIGTLLQWRGTPSEKQLAKLDKIFANLP
jgi:hypothetical protein